MEKALKKNIITEYARHEGDTGSSEVQIAILTTRINQLAEHFKNHKHDHHSQRSLMKLIGQRKRLLAYLSRENRESYRTIINKLGLRK